MAVGNALEVITREELRSLIDQRQGPAVSIYHPTERVVVEPEANSLRLKNLLGQAEEKLGRHGLRRPDIEALLEPLAGLLGDGDFWRHQLEGLALFAAPGFFRYYRLPFAVDESVSVGDSFSTKALLPALSDGHYYVLALSQNSVRLIRATRHGAEEIDLDGLDIPRSLAEALRYDDLQKPELSHHPTAPDRRTATGQRHQFHGHGESGEEQKTEIVRYFQGVDRGISKLLARENAPLVLAGVEYLHALYRFASGYKYIAENGLEGNFDHLSPSEFQERTWPLVQPLFYQRLQDDKERFLSLRTKGQGSTDLHEILEAAYAGRVDALFVKRGEERWGRFDPTGGGLTTTDAPGPGDVDLFDQASSVTLTRDGMVHVVEEADMPVDAPIAAVYRF